MAYRSLGRDAVRKGDKPLEWLERQPTHKNIHWTITPEFHEHLKKVARNRQTSFNQMLRYVMAVDTGYEAPEED